jgi:hypothetical protein
LFDERTSPHMFLLQLVIITIPLPEEKLIAINGYCRNRRKMSEKNVFEPRPIGLIACTVIGLFASVFHDFGGSRGRILQQKNEIVQKVYPGHSSFREITLSIQENDNNALRFVNVKNSGISLDGGVVDGDAYAINLLS